MGEVLQPLAAAAERAATSSFDWDGPDDDASLPSALQVPVAKLQTLLAGIAMTHAQALMHRAPEVGAFASHLKVLPMLHSFVIAEVEVVKEIAPVSEVLDCTASKCSFGCRATFPHWHVSYLLKAIGQDWLPMVLHD